jgi:putative membrane protein
VTAPLPDELPRRPVAEREAAPWHRLHPLSPLVRAGRQLMSLVVLLGGLLIANHQRIGGDFVTDVVIIAIALSGGFVSWLVTRWQIADGVLRVETGLIRRDSRRFPLSQIQAVDVVQTGLARVLGLAELDLRVAGGDASRSTRLACLRLADAERLRRDLLALSASAAVVAAGIGSDDRAAAAAAGPVADVRVPGDAGQVAVRGAATGASAVPDVVTSAVAVPSGAAASAPVRQPERLLFRVTASRLPVAILLSRSGLIAVGVVVAACLTVALTGRTSTIGPFLPFIGGVLINVWRQLNSEFGTTVATAGDGIRLRSGLIQTAAETIRPGRIQAVRLFEPLLWRVFGWCRVEVDVAGGRDRRENEGEGRRLRAVIPVGSRADANQLLAELLGGRPLAASTSPPSVARWKAPLSYHFLRWSGNDRFVVTAVGRVCRETTWVPLEKVQSIRWVQGPLQRWLDLATVHLDVAGKRISARISDRANTEALEILGTLPDLARAARATAG